MKKFLLLATIGMIAFLPSTLSATDAIRIAEPKEGQEYRVARLTACCTSIDSVKHIRDFTASAAGQYGLYVCDVDDFEEISK